MFISFFEFVNSKRVYGTGSVRARIMLEHLSSFLNIENCTSCLELIPIVLQQIRSMHDLRKYRKDLSKFLWNIELYLRKLWGKITLPFFLQSGIRLKTIRLQKWTKNKYSIQFIVFSIKKNSFIHQNYSEVCVMQNNTSMYRGIKEKFKFL